MDVLVRGIPPEVHAALTDRAQVRQVSLRAYLLDLLNMAVSEPEGVISQSVRSAGGVISEAVATTAALPEPSASDPAVLDNLARLAAQVSELVAAVAHLTERIEAHLSTPVGGEPVEIEGPQPPAPMARRLRRSPLARSRAADVPAPASPAPEPLTVERWATEDPRPSEYLPGPLPGCALGPIPALPYGAPPGRPPAFDRSMTQAELDRLREAAVALLPPESFEDAASGGKHLTASVSG